MKIFDVIKRFVRFYYGLKIEIVLFRVEYIENIFISSNMDSVKVKSVGKI